MRIFTTLICMLFLAFSASAQVVVLVNSPASIAGSYTFTNSFDNAWGADLTTDVWTADAVFIDDGTDPTTDGCTDPVNAAALVDKIVLIDRGVCEFGAKALKAQTAGAKAVVIFTNAPNVGPVGMGIGADGAQVTIPVVMLSYEAGQDIRTIMMTETVNMTIGHVVFDHDLGLAPNRVTSMANGVMPAIQADALGITFTPAVNVLNKGLNDETSITLEGTITHTPVGGTANQVYNESNEISFLAKDSSGYINLPEFTAVEGAGVYEVTYTTTSANGDTPAAVNDNTFTTEFILSDNIYCKGRWDALNNRPAFTGLGRTVSGGGNVEFLAGFEVPQGFGYKLDSLEFFVFTGGVSFGSLEGSSVNGYVYEWGDANGDNAITNDEITTVGYAPVTFPDTSATSAWVKVEIYDYEEFEPGGYVIPANNKKYFVGARYEGASLVYFGFDDGYDQTVAFENGLLDVNDQFNYPYNVVSAWTTSQTPDLENGGLFTDVAGSIVMALFLTPYTSPSIEVAPSNVAVTLSPNPANSQLVVESKLKSVTGGITYTIRDNAGRMVYNSSKTLNTDYDKVSFDVSQYAAGQYFIVVTTDQGIKAERFTVQH
ncbi:MAG: T9SS type A sorting domain-containing protein [Saprospiraceae bacterium]|nr:T9SS type A sorting domain-containing protein [Saprospiraceae bacterium]